MSEENKKPPHDEQTLAKLLEAAYVLQAAVFGGAAFQEHDELVFGDQLGHDGVYDRDYRLDQGQRGVEEKALLALGLEGLDRKSVV